VDPEAHIGKEKILQQHMRTLLASSGRKHRQAEEAGFFAPKSGNVSGPKGQCFHPEHCRFRQSYPHPSDHGAFSQAWGQNRVLSQITRIFTVHLISKRLKENAV